jgi:hypothetical protein
MIPTTAKGKRRMLEVIGIPIYAMYIGTIIKLNANLTSWNALTLAIKSSLAKNTCLINPELRTNWVEP